MYVAINWYSTFLFYFLVFDCNQSVYQRMLNSLPVHTEQLFNFVTALPIFK